MANITPTFKPSGVQLLGAQNSKITNLSIPLANTEVSHALSVNLKQILIRNRSRAEIKFSFTITESGTKYITIPGCATFFISDISFALETLYLQSPKAGTTVEILELY